METEAKGDPGPIGTSQSGWIDSRLKPTMGDSSVGTYTVKKDRGRRRWRVRFPDGSTLDSNNEDAIEWAAAKVAAKSGWQRADG